MAWAALRLPRFFRGAGRRALFPTYTDLPAPPEGGGTDSFGIISVLFREDLNRRFGQQANWQLYKKDKDNEAGAASTLEKMPDDYTLFTELYNLNYPEVG